MEALRKKIVVSDDGFIKLRIPSNFTREVEVIVLPVIDDQNQPESEYFECVAEDGKTYRVKDWTDDEFNQVSQTMTLKDDDTTAEDLFDV